MRDLLVRCSNHLEIAEQGREPSEIAVTSREVRETLKVLAQLAGELDSSTKIAVVTVQNERGANTTA